MPLRMNGKLGEGTESKLKKVNKFIPVMLL